ncbi:MAG: hypothetical protein HOY78_36985 [Saccharothrix sp.]|nr:hypothetical protein [Saccharothrix sp.]
MTEQLQLILAGDFGRGLQTYDVEFDGRRKLDSPLLTRTGRNRVNEPVALRSAGPDPESVVLLRREVDVLTRLLGRLTDRRYPTQLTRLIGHNPDHEPPYLLRTARGEPLTRLDRPLRADVLGPVVDDLVRILRHLAVSGVVHRRIGLSTLHWDGEGLQLVDFEHAVLAGLPAPACACCPDRPPVEGPARKQDDLLDAGLVLYRLFTDEDVTDPAEARRRLGLQDVVVRDLLEGVFDPDRTRRPDPLALLRRRKLPDPLSGSGRPVKTIADRETGGVEAFERLRADQRAFAAWYQQNAHVLLKEPVARSRVVAIVWTSVVALVIAGVVLWGALS